jgi:hypothetical protein
MQLQPLMVPPTTRLLALASATANLLALVLVYFA